MISIYKNKSISSKPEFQVSTDMESEFYEMMDRHIAMNEKYEKILDYRIYICTK